MGVRRGYRAYDSAGGGVVTRTKVSNDFENVDGQISGGDQATVQPPTESPGGSADRSA